MDKELCYPFDASKMNDNDVGIFNDLSQPCSVRGFPWGWTDGVSRNVASTALPRVTQVYRHERDDYNTTRI